MQFNIGFTPRALSKRVTADGFAAMIGG